MRSSGAGCTARCDPCRSRSSPPSPPRRCTPPPMTRTVSASAAAAAAPWRALWSRSAAHRTACLESTGWWSWKSGPTSTCSRCLLRYSFSPHTSIEVLTESVCLLVFRYWFLHDWCVKITEAAGFCLPRVWVVVRSFLFFFFPLSPLAPSLFPPRACLIVEF